MAVTKEIKRLEKSNVLLSVTVPREDVRAQYNEMMREYTKSLQLPGFRKGKVPQEVLERKFGDALKGDALGRIVEASMKEIFGGEDEESADSESREGSGAAEKLPRNEKPLPYSQPELQEEDLKLDLDQDFKFSVIYDVLPEVKIGQWKGLKVEYPYAEVDKEVIDKELEEIRDRNAIVMDREDDAAARIGDVATIDYQIFNENGEVAANMQRKDFVFTLGSGTNVFKFDDDIIGMKKGETKEFDKTFGDDFFDNELSGKTRKTQITLTALKEKQLPDLDDDLAQDVDEKFKTLDDLKNNIKDRLGKSLEARTKEKKLSELLGKIMENTPIVIPESMIKSEVEGRLRRIARYYNISVDVMMQMTGGDRMNEMREAAQKALHSRLIIETLMEEYNFEVTEDEIEKELIQTAADNDADLDEIKKHYESEQSMLYLKEDIKEKKMIDIMFAENTLNPGKKENYLVFMSDNG